MTRLRMTLSYEVTELGLYLLFDIVVSEQGLLVTRDEVSDWVGEILLIGGSCDALT